MSVGQVTSTVTVGKSVHYVGDGLGGIRRLDPADEEYRQEDTLVAGEHVVTDRLVTVVEGVEEFGNLAVVEAHHLDDGRSLREVAGLDVPPEGLELVTDHFASLSAVAEITLSGDET